MYKKLLVFSLSFCLGLLFTQIEYFYSSDSPNVSESASYPPITKNNEHIFAPLDAQTSNEEKRSRFSAAGLDDEKEVIDFYLKFQNAVATDDRKTVASMMSYPLSVLYADDHYKLMKNQTVYRSKIKNKTNFLREYDKIFDADFKKFIANIKFEELWAKYSGVATPRGAIWLNGICEDNKCKVYTLKFTTLNSGSVFIDRPDKKETK